MYFHTFELTDHRMLTGFRSNFKAYVLRNFRLLNVSAAIFVTSLGFVFLFAFNNVFILGICLVCSVILISNYLLLSKEIMKRKDEFHSEMQKQGKRYRSLVENMNDGLIYLDEQQNISFVNDKFCEISDFKKEEIMGKPFMKISSFTENREMSELNEDLKNKGAFRTETQIVKKDGQSVWVQISATPYFEDGKLIDKRHHE